MSAEAGPATAAGARDGAIRRVRLPADRRTPAAARAVVRSALTEAHLDELANEALLLTTELTTNAVEHARTELDIEVVADEIGLTVTVSDFAPGSGDELAVGNRNDSTEINEVSERAEACCSSTTSPAVGAPRTCPPGRASGSGWTAPVPICRPRAPPVAGRRRPAPTRGRAPTGPRRAPAR